ncbi:MAG: ROK family protein [Bacteroidaceae bacterium]|nr:ROK family protein [Bacteroidaceae bacterium]MBP9636830.1 ROK family protein [Bacteroidaceae bacterium]
MTDLEKPYVLGMDIGGTNSIFGVVDAHGTVLSKDAVKTKDYPKIEDYIEAIATRITPLIEAAGGIQKFRGFGIGAPNGNFYHGTIEYAPNLPWKGVIIPLAKFFADRLGIPVALTNDANAAAIGEMTYGAAKGMKDFIMITLGTGVGSGIVINGQLVYGHNGFAGELGHITAERNGRLCGCGKHGCLETYCSATGVARTACEILHNTTTESLLRKLKPEEISSKEVFDAAMQGDVVALQIFEETGTILGRALADFIAFSCPEAIILFGGLTKAGDLLMRPIEKAMEENVLPIFKGKTKLLTSAMPDADAAVLGASALAWEL